MLDHKAYAKTICHLAHTLLRGLHQKWHRRVVLADKVAKVNARVKLLGCGVVILVDYKANVRDNTQHIVLIALIHRHCIVVVCRHKNLWTGTLAGNLLLLIERIADRGSILLQHELVNGW